MGYKVVSAIPGIHIGNKKPRQALHSLQQLVSTLCLKHLQKINLPPSFPNHEKGTSTHSDVWHLK
eukprot:1217368-Prorocentrum_lima.AAC.1